MEGVPEGQAGVLRFVTVDVDSAEGLEQLWAELRRHREIRNLDPELREHIIRRASRLPHEVAQPILEAVNEQHPELVLESFYTTLVPNQPTTGWYRRRRTGSTRCSGTAVAA